MRNLLAEGVPCLDTVAATAYEFGLITKDAVERVKSVGDVGGCECMRAARQVLLENFASSAKADKLKSQVDEVWAAVESRSRRRIDSPVGSSANGDGHNHDCEMSAPVVFDVLLQELSRY